MEKDWMINTKRSNNFPVQSTLFKMNYSLLSKSLSKHISLSKEELELFISLLKSRKYGRGEFLLRQGEVCKYESFIVKGCFKSFYEDENSIEHITEFLIEDWWANDLYSLLTQTESKMNIEAIEESEVLQISKQNLEVLYQKVPKLERFFRILFQNAFIAHQEQINSALSLSAEERYLLFVRKKPYAEERFSQKDVASYLGITPQFLSGLKKKIRKVNVD